MYIDDKVLAMHGAVIACLCSLMVQDPDITIIELSRATNVNYRSVQRAILRMKKSGLIQIKRTCNKNTYIVVDQSSGQSSVSVLEEEEPKSKNKRKSSGATKSDSGEVSSQTSASAPPEEEPKRKKKEPKKEYAPNVKLTESEYNNLCDQYTKSVVDRCIERMSEYDAEHSGWIKRKHINCAVTIPKWIQEDTKKGGRKQPNEKQLSIRDKWVYSSLVNVADETITVTDHITMYVHLYEALESVFGKERRDKYIAQMEFNRRQNPKWKKDENVDDGEIIAQWIIQEEY